MELLDYSKHTDALVQRSPVGKTQAHKRMEHTGPPKEATPSLKAPQHWTW